MSDYIISIDVIDIKESPINSEIYEFRKDEHDELVKSIELNGLLEPLVIDKDNNLIRLKGEDTKNGFKRRIPIHPRVSQMLETLEPAKDSKNVFLNQMRTVSL